MHLLTSSVFFPRIFPLGAADNCIDIKMSERTKLTKILDVKLSQNNILEEPSKIPERQHPHQFHPAPMKDEPTGPVIKAQKMSINGETNMTCEVYTLKDGSLNVAHDNC
jgi:hypothetical protein